MELIFYYMWQAIKFIHLDSVFEIDLHQIEGNYYYELTEFPSDGRRRIYKAKYTTGRPLTKNTQQIIDWFKPQIDHYYAVNATLKAIQQLIKSDALKDKNVFNEYMRFSREIDRTDDETFERHISKKHAVEYEIFKLIMYGFLFEAELKKRDEPLVVGDVEHPYSFEISFIRRGERQVLARKLNLEIWDEYRNRKDFLLKRIERLIDEQINDQMKKEINPIYGVRPQYYDMGAA